MKSTRETRAFRKCVIVGAALLWLFQAVPLAYAKSGQQKVNTRQGKRTYDQSCVECHGTGKDGAPRLEIGFSRKNSEWTRRKFNAQEVLDQHKQKSYVQIPAKDGQPKLTDQDVVNAVHYMMIMLRSEPVR